MTSSQHFAFDLIKNDQVVAILMKTGLNNIVRPTLFTVVNNIVTPDSGSILLTSVNNVGRTTLFNPVKQQAHSFTRVSSACTYTDFN
jgi:ABC-type thiamine transport system ATPase subunit